MNRRSLEDLANWIGIPCVALYVYSMLIYPWIDGNGNWAHVHAVWDKWQTFNAGLIAFVASLIALNISRINNDRQRERDFLASRAFLPAAFSELTSYFKTSATLLTQVWEDGVQGVATPTPPSDYRDIFKECIRHAAPGVGEYLTTILVKLQVHQARMEDIIDGSNVADRYALISYLFQLGFLKVLVDKQFQFARGEDPFDESPLAWADFKNAYGLLDLHIEEFEADDKWNLKAVTQRAIERMNKHH